MTTTFPTVIISILANFKNWLRPSNWSHRHIHNFQDVLFIFCCDFLLLLPFFSLLVFRQINNLICSFFCWFLLCCHIWKRDVANLFSFSGCDECKININKRESMKRYKRVVFAAVVILCRVFSLFCVPLLSLIIIFFFSVQLNVEILGHRVIELPKLRTFIHTSGEHNFFKYDKLALFLIAYAHCVYVIAAGHSNHTLDVAFCCTNLFFSIPDIVHPEIGILNSSGIFQQWETLPSIIKTTDKKQQKYRKPSNVMFSASFLQVILRLGKATVKIDNSLHFVCVTTNSVSCRQFVSSHLHMCAQWKYVENDHFWIICCIDLTPSLCERVIQCCDECRSSECSAEIIASYRQSICVLCVNWLSNTWARIPTHAHICDYAPTLCKYCQILRHTSYRLCRQVARRWVAGKILT